MGDLKDILISAGALALGLLVINWLTTPKPPQWPSGYGFASQQQIQSPISGDIDYGRYPYI